MLILVSFCRLIYLLNVLPVTFPGDGHAQAFSAPDGLAKNYHMDLKQGLFTMSMDFHPVQQTLLLGLSSNIELYFDV